MRTIKRKVGRKGTKKNKSTKRIKNNKHKGTKRIKTNKHKGRKTMRGGVTIADRIKALNEQGLQGLKVSAKKTNRNIQHPIEPTASALQKKSARNSATKKENSVKRTASSLQRSVELKEDVNHARILADEEINKKIAEYTNELKTKKMMRILENFCHK